MASTTLLRLGPWLLLALCVALSAGAGYYSSRPPAGRNAVVSPLGSGARNTVMADFNGDGRLDLAVADMDEYHLFNHAPETDTSAVSIWLGEENGQLRRAALLHGLHANLVAGGDLDQDGDQDLITGDSEGDHLTILLNDGHANYHRAGRLPAPRPRNFVLGDMNDDGVPDLVLKGENCSITVGYNDGHAHFRLKTEELSPLWPDEKDAPRSAPAGRHGYCPFEVALADVDRDGDLDIVTLNGENFHPTTLSILYNDGPHGKLEIEELVYATSYVANLTIGDVNGDSWPDLVMSGLGDSNENPNIVFMLLNDGHGRYGTSNITMGGLDNGAPDEFLGPTLARRLSTGALDAWRVALGDVDHDGDLDLVVSDHWGKMQVRRNRGNASFEDLYPIATRLAYQAELPIGDLNDDGQLEWLVPHQPVALPLRPAKVGDRALLDQLR